VRVALGLLCFAAAAASAEVTLDRIRNAAERAITLIQSSQEVWYRNASCFSCHHQILPALAFREARRHGIRINEEAAHADAVRAFTTLANLDRAVQYTHINDPALDDAYFLRGADAAGVRTSIVTAALARHLAARQKADGHWDTYDSRPPQAYSRFTTTANTLRALQLYGHSARASETHHRIERARRWLASHQPRNTEERSYRLFGLYWASADHALLARDSEELLKAQQADGGWNSLDGRSSDAYSTGQALMALHEAGGVPTSHPDWQRGIRNLLDSQHTNGSWHVISRLHPPADVSPPFFDAGYPYGHDQFISVMGASWALMALSAALGEPKSNDVRSLAEAVPTNVPSWAETALFGSLSELRLLLEQGMNPNSATVQGTTALMMAVPDRDKTQLLLDRGANVNARARTKYSALLVAAQYPDSVTTVRLLLDRGAEVRLPRGTGMPLLNATALNLAARAGNADLLPLFLKRGDRLQEKLIVQGLFPSGNLTSTIGFGDAATLAALLDAGISVDARTGGGNTLLGFAAITNQIDIARLLISRGANLDAVDTHGMTPLHYAASIDFGDSVMVELLVEKGANARARNKDGFTALELATKYDHRHLIRVLRQAEQ
jgi:ankyrin repeat protein